jgi:hypothetical protein
MDYLAKRRYSMCTAAFHRRHDMRIHVSEPELMDDLSDYLRRCSCTVAERGSGLLEADPQDRNVEPVYLRMELDAYLRVWRAMHPGVEALIAEESRAGAPAA